VRTNKRIWLLAITLLLVVAPLAACGSGGGGTAQETEQGQSAWEDAPVTEALSADYKAVAENERFVLSLKESNLAIRLQDKKSGYVWSSVVDTPVEGENNESWNNFIQSGLAIEYFDKATTEPNRTDLLTEANKSVKVTSVGGGFQAQIRLLDLKLGFDLQVKLDGNQLVVSVPNASIREGGEAKLASVSAYPFLGATRKGDVPGYMFVPDGSGALIPLADNNNKYKLPYDAKIYGSNYGIDAIHRERVTNDPFQIHFPVFGIVHEAEKHAVFGVVENGQYNARIIAYPNGVNTQYNWITTKFLLRESYLQPTSRTMGGLIVSEKKRNTEDMQTRYFFLNGDEASYVGMAKTYRGYLERKGVLKREAAASGAASGAGETGVSSASEEAATDGSSEANDATKTDGAGAANTAAKTTAGTGGSSAANAEADGSSTGDIPLRLDVLGADTTNGLFSKQLVPMTTVSQLEAIAADAKRNGIGNLLVVYKGWNEGGLSGTSPYKVSFEGALGSSGDFKRLMQRMKDEGTQLYFYDDYTIAYDESTRFAARSDAMERLDKTVLALDTYKDVYDKMYYMSAAKAKAIHASNLAAYGGRGIGNVAVDSTGRILFSEWADGEVSPRKHTADTYASMMEQSTEKLNSLALYTPNDYMLKYAGQVLDVPLYSSQYIFTSESVPFAEMVLKGYKPYFAPYANFFANSAKERLRLIEYGAYPSYYVTHESSYKLKFTNSSDLYTSAYADWKDEIAGTYKMVNEALKKVEGATMDGREKLSEQVVKVTYSNGVQIVVNYGDADFAYGGTTVPGKGFKVIEVNS